MMNHDFIEGIGKKGEDFIIVPGIDKIFSIPELTGVTGINKTIGFEENI